MMNRRTCNVTIHGDSETQDFFEEMFRCGKTIIFAVICKFRLHQPHLCYYNSSKILASYLRFLHVDKSLCQEEFEKEIVVLRAPTGRTNA